MQDSFLTETFFPIIRAGLGLPSSVALQEELDYERIIETAKKQAILPIVREGLNALKIQGEGPNKVQIMCMNDIFLFVHRDTALKSIRDCFEKNNIDFVLLKGSVLRDFYPEQWMRTSCDIDVLVREEDLDNAISALQKETDFKYDKRLYHDISLMSHNVHLELHFSIKEDMDNIDKLLSKVWEYAIKKEGSRQYCLSPEYQIFYVVAHMSYHFVQGGLGIRPYIDLWLLRNKTHYDESIVKKMCDQCGVLKFYEKSCDLSSVWLEGTEHNSITRALEKYSLDGGVFGNQKTISLAIQKKHSGIMYFATRLFICRQSLEILYPNLKNHPNLFAFYQVKRWLDALLYKRLKVKNEIKILKNTKKEDIQSLNQLFDCVGL